MITSTQEEALQNHINGRFLLLLNTDNLSTPPTQVQLTSALGNAADSPGQIVIYDDSGSNTNTYLIASNGQSWQFLAMTKA